MKRTVSREQEVREPYRSLAATITHRQMSLIAEHLAQEARDELLRQNVAVEDIGYSGQFGLRRAAGGPLVWIEAFNFDRSFDWDKVSAEASCYSEMPGDAAFRVNGTSLGMFNGRWIFIQFERRLADAGIGFDRATDGVSLESLAVQAWVDERAA